MAPLPLVLTTWLKPLITPLVAVEDLPNAVEKHDLRHLRLSSPIWSKSLGTSVLRYSGHFRRVKNRADFLEKKHVHGPTISPGVTSRVRRLGSTHLAVAVGFFFVIWIVDDWWRIPGDKVMYRFAPCLIIQNGRWWDFKCSDRLLVPRVLLAFLFRIVLCHHLCVGRYAALPVSKGRVEMNRF